MLFRIHMQWIEASSKQSRYSSRPICLKYQLSGSQSQISTYKFMWGNSSTLINVITYTSYALGLLDLGLGLLIVVLIVVLVIVS